MPRRKLLTLVLLAASVLLASCSGESSAALQAHNQSAALSGASGKPASPQFSLPAPKSLLPRIERQASFATPLAIDGANYASALPSNRVLVSGSALGFSPLGSGSGLSQAAYAMFDFDLSASSPEPELRLVWTGAQPAAGTAWLGLGNLVNNLWDWRPAPAGSPVDIGSLQKYKDIGSGKLLAAVVLTGSDICQLARLRIGTPVLGGSALIYPIQGLTPLHANVDATGWGVPGAHGLVDCDWDGDGTPEESDVPRDALIPHDFGAGFFSPKLHYHDDEGFSADFDLSSVRSYIGTWSHFTVAGNGTDVQAYQPRLAIIADHVCIAYPTQEGAVFPLYFRQANDPTTQDWNAAVTLQADSDVNKLGALIDMNGLPALAYFRNNTGVRFQAAIDANGAAWNTPVTAMAAATSAGRCQLAMVAGRPAVAMVVSSAPLYKRADDAAGATWTGTTYNPATNVANECALGEIDGNPAIAVYDFVGGRYEVHRSSLATGEEFNWPDTGGGAATTLTSSLCMGTLSGLPIVLGYGGTGTDSAPLLIRANDAAGSGWESSFMDLASGSHRGLDISFTEALGFQEGSGLALYKDETSFKPRISFFDFPPGGSVTATSMDIDTADKGDFCQLVLWHGVPVAAYENGNDHTITVSVLE